MGDECAKCMPFRSHNNKTLTAQSTRPYRFLWILCQRGRELSRILAQNFRTCTLKLDSRSANLPVGSLA